MLVFDCMQKLKHTVYWSTEIRLYILINIRYKYIVRVRNYSAIKSETCSTKHEVVKMERQEILCPLAETGTIIVIAEQILNIW